MKAEITFRIYPGKIFDRGEVETGLQAISTGQFQPSGFVSDA